MLKFFWSIIIDRTDDPEDQCSVEGCKRYSVWKDTKTCEKHNKCRYTDCKIFLRGRVMACDEHRCHVEKCPFVTTGVEGPNRLCKNHNYCHTCARLIKMKNIPRNRPELPRYQCPDHTCAFQYHEEQPCYRVALPNTLSEGMPHLCKGHTDHLQLMRNDLLTIQREMKEEIVVEMDSDILDEKHAFSRLQCCLQQQKQREFERKEKILQRLNSHLF